MGGLITAASSERARVKKGSDLCLVAQAKMHDEKISTHMTLPELPEEIWTNIWKHVFSYALDEIEFGNENACCDCCMGGFDRELLCGKCNCMCSSCYQECKDCRGRCFDEGGDDD